MTTRKAAGQDIKKCSSEASEGRIINKENKENKEKLKRDTTTISASEVNRFTYCQYQWYYERLYGRTELGKLYRERNERLKLENTTEGNFSRGRDYHKNEYLRYRLKRIFTIVLTLVLILLAIFLWLRMG